MSENKKKESVFTKRGFFVALVVAVSLMVIMLVMNLIMPKDASNQLDEEAWNDAVQQSTGNRTEGAKAVSASATPKPSPTPAATKDVNAAADTAAAAAVQGENAQQDSTESAALLLQAPVKGDILKDYSIDELVYFPTMQDWRVHEGIDYAVDLGTEVHAAADGTVESVTEDSMLGASVVLRHADGTQTMYANLEEGSAPEAGKTVKAGETIGKVGQTAALEINDGTHLHFAVMKDDKMMDPHTYLEDLPGSGGGEE